MNAMLRKYAAVLAGAAAQTDRLAGLPEIGLGSDAVREMHAAARARIGTFRCADGMEGRVIEACYISALKAVEKARPGMGEKIGWCIIGRKGALFFCGKPV